MTDFNGIIKRVKCLIILLLLLVVQLAYSQNNTIPKSWKLGTSTMLLDDLALETFHAAKKSGISSIEVLWNTFLKKTPAERLEIADLIAGNAREAKLEIWSAHLPYGVSYDISTIDEKKRLDIVKSVKEYIDLSARLKVKQMVIHASGDKVPVDVRDKRILASKKSLKELLEYANKKNIGLNVECLPRMCLGNTSKELLGILDGLPGLGICFDSNHTLKEKPEEFVNAVGSRIKMVHISDYDMVDEKHWMPGKGVNNWNKIISALINAEFSGRFMYELSKKNQDTFTFADLGSNFEQLKRTWKTR